MQKYVLIVGEPNDLNEKEKEQAINQNIKEKQTIGIIAIIMSIIILDLVYFVGVEISNSFNENKLLEDLGISTSNNTVVITERKEEDMKEDIMNWLGFEKVKK